jgi:hypothetical protein
MYEAWAKTGAVPSPQRAKRKREREGGKLVAREQKEYGSSFIPLTVKDGKKVSRENWFGKDHSIKKLRWMGR